MNRFSSALKFVARFGFVVTVVWIAVASDSPWAFLVPVAWLLSLYLVKSSEPRPRP